MSEQLTDRIVAIATKIKSASIVMGHLSGIIIATEVVAWMFKKTLYQSFSCCLFFSELRCRFQENSC